MDKKRIQDIWNFIEEQFVKCRKRMEEKDYREAIDLIYDIAGNISNLYWLIEYSQTSTDKGKILNNLSILYTRNRLSKDYGIAFRENWELRNIAKYGYFASPKSVINSTELPESVVQELFILISDLFNECKKYIDRVSSPECKFIEEHLK